VSHLRLDLRRRLSRLSNTIRLLPMSWLAPFPNEPWSRLVAWLRRRKSRYAWSNRQAEPERLRWVVQRAPARRMAERALVPDVAATQGGIESWRRDYNWNRRKRVTGGLMPAQYATQLAGRGIISVPGSKAADYSGRRTSVKGPCCRHGFRYPTTCGVASSAASGCRRKSGSKS